MLTHTEGAIRLEVDQDNAVISLVSQKDGKRFGAITELEKLNGFRKFATEARKASIAAEIIDPVRNLCFDAIKQEHISEPTVINAGNLNSLKEFKLQLDYLKDNIEFTEDTLRRLSSGEVANDCCDLLNDWIGKIILSIRTTIAKMVRGEETKGFISDNLFEKKVPKWAYDKLAKGELARGGLTSVELIFFPRDPRKGIYYTVREMTDDRFSNKHDWLLQSSQYQFNVLRNADLLKEACNVKEKISFTSESDTIGSALRGEKVFLTAPQFNKESFLDDKASKINLLGLASFATPKLAINTLLNVGLAFQTAHFRTADVGRDFWAKLYPSIDFFSDAGKKKGFVTLINEANDISPSKECFEWNSGKKDIFKAILPAMAGISTDSKILVDLLGMFDTFTKVREIVHAVPAKAEEKTLDGRSILAHARAEVKAAPGYTRPASSSDSYTDVYEAIFPDGSKERSEASALYKKMRIDPDSLQKTLKPSTQSHFSDLSKPGIQVVEMFRKHDKLSFLADPVKDWLCGFSTRKIQSVAALFVRAQFADLTGLEEVDTQEPVEESRFEEDDNY